MLELTTQDKLKTWARMNGGCNEGTIPFDDIVWNHQADFPTERLLTIMPRDKWREWLKEELTMLQEEFGDNNRWSRLLVEELEEPCVFLIHEDDRIEIWDGWHRSAAAIATNKPTISVVVGYAREHNTKLSI